MGVSASIRVGPYVAVHNPERDTTESYNTCSNTECKKHRVQFYGSDGKFCTECGSQITEQTFPCLGPIDFDEFEVLGDRLHKVTNEQKFEDYDVFISNVRGHGLSLDPENNEYLFDLTNTDRQEQVDKFTKSFDKEIKKLKETFGADAVTIKWGVVSWLS